MANAEQLALLKAGVEGWNKWREEKRGEKVDLVEADLRGVDLRGADLLGADLRKVKLTGAKLEDADLRHALLRKADLSYVDLHGVHLNGAYLTDVRLFGATLLGANLSGADLSGVDLNGFYLDGTDLSEAKLGKVNLHGSHLREANLRRASLIGAKLSAADLWRANLSGASLSLAELGGANFRGADLSKAHLSRANLMNADLREADLTGADLSYSNLVGAKVGKAQISKSKVYGVSVWDLEGKFNEQKDLIITPPFASPITVDNIKIAQFVYLILNNQEIRDVINMLTSKTVLILGRFAIPERKVILDTLKDKLREYDLLPIVFDFDRPTDQDFTETIKTLAGISYFVIADVTNPKSSPLELQATIPDYQIPFVPIIQEGEYPFAMMVDLQKKYNWVLDTISYDSVDTLIEILKPHIIDPAIKKRDELRLIKAKEPTIISGRELRDKKGSGKP